MSICVEHERVITALRACLLARCIRCSGRASALGVAYEREPRIVDMADGRQFRHYRLDQSDWDRCELNARDQEALGRIPFGKSL